MRLLEIGPLTRGLAPKREGWTTCIVDQRNREDLVESYDYLGPTRQDIEDVDVIWCVGPLHETVGQVTQDRFDAIICSHVLEHLTDPIAFIQSAERLLKPGGKLLLILPDKRFCFDFFRPLTMTGDMIDAHRMKAHNHQYRTAFNHVAYCAGNKGILSWELGFISDLTFVSDLKTAMIRAESHAGPEGQPGHDFHAWCFVPASFQLIALELFHLDLIPFSVEQTSPQRHAEFFVALTLNAPPSMSDEDVSRARLKLLAKVLDQSAQQARLARSGGFLGFWNRGMAPEILVAVLDRAIYNMRFRFYKFIVRTHIAYKKFRSLS